MKESINSSQICLLKASDDLVMLCHVVKHGLDWTRKFVKQGFTDLQIYSPCFTNTVQSVFYNMPPMLITLD
jgi:hypothetical protein